MNTIAGRLNGRVKLLKGAGFGATWVVPSVLGLCSVAAAEPELKVRTAFEEGFGVVGGALGTLAGANFASAFASGLFLLCGLCLGPFGMFVTVFICASVGGIIGSKLFKAGGRMIYDLSPQLDTGRIYHSPEQFFLEAVK